MVSQIALCSATTLARGRWVTVGCTVTRVCGWTRTNVCLWDIVCAWCKVVDGAEGGWYLVGGREIRAGSSRLFQQLACTIKSGGSERETEKQWAGGGKKDRVAARGCFACSHPLFAALFKKISFSTALEQCRRYRSYNSERASRSKWENNLFGIHR